MHASKFQVCEFSLLIGQEIFRAPWIGSEGRWDLISHLIWPGNSVQDRFISFWFPVAKTKEQIKM